MATTTRKPKLQAGELHTSILTFFAGGEANGELIQAGAQPRQPPGRRVVSAAFCVHVWRSAGARQSIASSAGGHRRGPGKPGVAVVRAETGAAAAARPGRLRQGLRRWPRRDRARIYLARIPCSRRVRAIRVRADRGLSVRVVDVGAARYAEPRRTGRTASSSLYPFAGAGGVGTGFQVDPTYPRHQFSPRINFRPKGGVSMTGSQDATTHPSKFSRVRRVRDD